MYFPSELSAWLSGFPRVNAESQKKWDEGLAAVSADLKKPDRRYEAKARKRNSAVAASRHVFIG